MSPSAIRPDSRALDLRARAPGSASSADARVSTELIAPRLRGHSETPVGLDLRSLIDRLSVAGPSFAWLSPDGELVAGFGVAARFEASGGDRFAAAKRWLSGLAENVDVDGNRERPPLIAVGGFSFADASAGAPAGLGDAVFFVPEETWLLTPGRAARRVLWSPDELGVETRLPARAWTRARLPEWTEAEWTGVVRELLERIDRGVLEKAVLARAVEIDAPHRIDPARVLASLIEANPHCYRFLVRPSGGAAFVGASPERLVSLRGRDVASDAVAGTARDAALLESVKDRSEQAIVVRHIVDSLEPLCESVEAEREPTLQRHRNLAHLRTRVAGRARLGVHVLDLVARVHPTPAVAGAPREDALALLRDLEPSHRGWYAGAVGWIESGGDGDFAVGIRSALIEGPRALLFAGAGIVAGSDPAAEWAETDVKLSVMREAIDDAG